tara:strand:+ start:610 stop:1392 length:783 start_codon:yes stop_codon:yes gene_type:complete
MSKIVTKKQLDLVMENTMSEMNNVVESKEEMKITKDQMDELHKEGHCMCGDKCLVYTEDIKGDDKKMTELLEKLASEKMDCVVVSKEQMDMLHKDGKCDCNNNVTLSYEDEMKEGDYMNDMSDHMGDDMKSEGDHMDDHMTEEMCNECGGTMKEGICEGCGSMKEGDVDENFVLAADEAKDKGDDEFEYPKGSGKMHPVTIKADIKNEEKEVTEITVGEKKYKVVEESVNKLTEALSNTTNKEIIKEDMDFFNKMVNYKK